MVSVTSDAVFAELSDTLGAETVVDPYPVFAERRRTTPVLDGDMMADFGFPERKHDRPTFAFYRHEDIVMALRDGETYSSALSMERHKPILGRTILGMDGAEHRAHRGLFQQGFTRKLTLLWREQLLGPVARAKAQDVASVREKRADLVDFALRFPVRMVYEIIGFPPDDQLYAEFSHAGITMMIGQLSQAPVSTTSPEETALAVARAADASALIYEQLLEIVRRKRTDDPGADDFIGHLLRAEFEGGKLGDEQIALFLRSLVSAASDSTTRSWLNLMVCLLQRPELLDEVRADRSLLLPLVDEAVRFESTAVLLARLTTRATQVRGVDIPAGSVITLVTGSGNRDEDAFERPDQLDIHRTDKKPSLGFSFGPHRCIGALTARHEILEATDALLDALPNLRLDPEASPPEIRGIMLRSPASLSVVWD